MSYSERTVEWSPHPDKSEQVFLSVVTRAAFESGRFPTEEPVSDYQDSMEAFLIASARAWQGAQAVLRARTLENARQLIDLAIDLPTLKEEAQKVAVIPQTHAERKVTMELYQRRVAELSTGGAQQ